MSASDSTISILNTVSFLSMCFALGVGAVIILGAMIRGKRAAAQPTALPTPAESFEPV